MTDIRLIATDLDGTVIGGVSDFGLYDDFRDVLVKFKQKHNSVWATCTGRGMSSTRRFITPMSERGIRPDYIIVNQAYIYSHTWLGYLPHIFWNCNIRCILWKNQMRMQRAINRWHDRMRGVSFGVVTLYRRRNRLRMRFNSEESAVVAENMLRKESAEFMHLQIKRDICEIDVFQLPFTKGLAVSELARHIGIGPEKILTIGDGHNDISMLEPETALHTACPANAQYDVMRVVNRNGGHIARSSSMAGVLEILHAYMDGNVCSDLPEGLTPPVEKPRNRPANDLNYGPARSLVSFILFWVVVYTVLLVVSWFGLLPFSGYITKPFYYVVRVIEKFCSFFF